MSGVTRAALTVQKPFAMPYPVQEQPALPPGVAPSFMRDRGGVLRKVDVGVPPVRDVATQKSTAAAADLPRGVHSARTTDMYVGNAYVSNSRHWGPWPDTVQMYGKQ